MSSEERLKWRTLVEDTAMWRRGSWAWMVKEELHAAKRRRLHRSRAKDTFWIETARWVRCSATEWILRRRRRHDRHWRERNELKDVEAGNTTWGRRRTSIMAWRRQLLLTDSCKQGKYTRSHISRRIRGRWQWMEVWSSWCVAAEFEAHFSRSERRESWEAVTSQRMTPSCSKKSWHPGKILTLCLCQWVSSHVGVGSNLLACSCKVGKRAGFWMLACTRCKRGRIGTR